MITIGRLMNNRVGVLEVGPQSGPSQVAPGVLPIYEDPKRQGSVSEKDKLPASSRPPEAKGGEQPA